MSEMLITSVLDTSGVDTRVECTDAVILEQVAMLASHLAFILDNKTELKFPVKLIVPITKLLLEIEKCTPDDIPDVKTNASLGRCYICGEESIEICNHCNNSFCEKHVVHHAMDEFIKVMS